MHDSQHPKSIPPEDTAQSCWPVLPICDRRGQSSCDKSLMFSMSISNLILLMSFLSAVIDVQLNLSARMM